MTDFDFEILEAVAQYGGGGISEPELEAKHFKECNLLYNLLELSKKEEIEQEQPSGQKIKTAIKNSACLKAQIFKVENVFLGASTEYLYYSLTDKGRSLLQNWQRRRDEKSTAEKQRTRKNFLLSIVVGTFTGILATTICELFLQ